MTLHHSFTNLVGGQISSRVGSLSFAIRVKTGSNGSTSGFAGKTREMLGRKVILAGLLEKEYGRYLSEAFEMRQTSTYDIYASFGEEVSDIVNRAEGFVERARKILEEDNRSTLL